MRSIIDYSGSINNGFIFINGVKTEIGMYQEHAGFMLQQELVNPAGADPELSIQRIEIQAVSLLLKSLDNTATSILRQQGYLLISRQVPQTAANCLPGCGKIQLVLSPGFILVSRNRHIGYKFPVLFI